MGNDKVKTMLALAVLGLACAEGVGVGARHVDTPTGTGSGLQAGIVDLEPVKPLPATEAQEQADAAIDRWFQSHPTRRAYLQVDKPLYQPGETVWFRAAFRNTKDMTAASQFGVTVQLVSPKGSVVAQKRVMTTDGVVANDFGIPEGSEGGEYALQFIGDEGTQEKRAIIIAAYEAPRLKKDLEFIRKAYGPGDSVAAAVSVARSTGEPFAGRKLTFVVTVDDNDVARATITTDDKGNALAKFRLPDRIAREDGLLTILADDGGVTESIQKRIPIVLGQLDFAMFPEGGDLIESLPGRVYFSARNTIGKPADVEGKVVDDRGELVSSFSSLHDGMGRFEIIPRAGRTYRVELSKPAGIRQTIAVPAAKAEGCSVVAVDDFDSNDDELRVATWCTTDRTVLVEAVLRERRLASASIVVKKRRPALVALDTPKGEQGAVRVTLLADDLTPIAERLVYRGRKRDMKIDVTADRKTYGPRDAVTLTLQTTDQTGKPVSASVGLSVVDDTVLSFADDKKGHIMSKLYLESELGPDQEIEEPDFYFGDAPEAAAALDLVMGTQGWRRFEWQYVAHPEKYADSPRPVASAAAMPMDDLLEAAMPAAAAPKPEPEPAPAPVAERARQKMAAKPAPRPQREERAKEQAARAQPVVVGRLAAEKKQLLVRRDAARARDRGRGAGMGVRDDALAAGEWDAEGGARADWGWAPVRQFPVPTYKPGYTGPRSDFRETLFWAHDVRTDESGSATVTFYMSDAITSFRATAEGVSVGGLAGHGETVVQSKMPVSLDVRMPLEVSSGDSIELPVTLSNETGREMVVDVQAAFGASFKVGENPLSRPAVLAAGEKQAFFFPLTVVGKGGDGEVRVSMKTAGLSDEVHKKIRVVPLGFPFEVSVSGTARSSMAGTIEHDVDLTGAMPGTITASIVMYPSPLASMTQGVSALLREPGGCFEQTSATNYPNVMVMSYLEHNDAADPAIVADATAKLNRGYKLLTGYETKQKGYEWFGENPGHEALTAYGLMQFKDMAGVYDGVDASMVERTAQWLMSRRDGKGGYARNGKALDTFGRASYETTNAYVTWALSEAGRTKDLHKELALSETAGLASKDPYIVALAANTWLNVDAKGGDTSRIVQRLVEMQDKTGNFPHARESITMSGGESLDIETTALATLALIKASADGHYEGQVRSSVDWLNGKRGGYGEWGNTQGTVLALKALAAYAVHSRQTQAPGVATVIVNDKEVGKIAFAKGRKQALTFDDLGGRLKPGKNTIQITLDSEATLPYSVAIEYRSARPQSSAKATIAVETSLAKKSVKLGEGIKLHARITNTSDKGQPMTLARIGLPGGLTFQTWQLKELRDKRTVGFYETRQREVILYFRDMKPSATVDLDLDLVASIPGKYTAPASSAYLYYTNEDKTWTNPLAVTVEP